MVIRRREVVLGEPRMVTAKWKEVKMSGLGAPGAACCMVRVCGKNSEALLGAGCGSAAAVLP